ncbi:MAG TPA: hypothetical protein VKR43_00495 [Bryobacteraceae bacterium]|nr:hypothetical protein [Bryobacteraceae bacterium]
MDAQTANVRTADASLVSVTVLEPPSKGNIEAAVVGASQTRLRVRLSAPLPRDAYLVVNLKNHMLFGEVVYCCASSGAYEAGLLIQESHCLGDLGNPPTTLTEILEREKIAAPDCEPDSTALPEAEAAGQWRFVRSVG